MISHILLYNSLRIDILISSSNKFQNDNQIEEINYDFISGNISKTYRERIIMKHDFNSLQSEK